MTSDSARVAQWFDRTDWIKVGSSVAVTLLVAVILLFIARRLIGGIERFTASHAQDIESQKRATTAANVLRKLASSVIVALAAVNIFNELGISIMPFLATAGVAGIAIAFGAQSLVKDFFRGFFLLAGNQIRQGDVVTIAGKSGLVEDVTLRYVQLRDYEGNVHFVPNGEITVVTSSSRTFAYAVFDVTIALEQAVEPVIEVMRTIAAQMRAHAIFGRKILEDLDIAGIENWTPGGITLRARMKVQALEQAHVRREFLLRLKQAFDHHRIQQPRNTVMMIEKDGAAQASKPPEGPPPPK